ncbi:MAG: hypothetical protein BGO01_14220 [Armatimonadetes bacterium 55-13]|nr:uracil-DNA glycosylase [Armatimonadota bacterium]OJU64877.1 MAG: hypothetical protein BGO01_14220 [Armatimonadetes bacterium 55-13]
MNQFDLLNSRIIACEKCPRLVTWRELVAITKKRAYENEVYWGKPVPLFGDPSAKHLIVGLAPAAHGANRTGQMFTGDRSGDWLFRALYKAGVANHSETQNRFDGMLLKDVMIAATAHCAPPENKPTPEEIQNCSQYLSELIASRQWHSILCLGNIAWQQVHRLLAIRPPKFGHGVFHSSDGCRLVASYHPSQQNTFTGRLTEPMLDSVINQWLAI